MWIEVQGRQHRVCWRTNQPAPSPKKAYEKFATRDDAQSFINFARWAGLPAARPAAKCADGVPNGMRIHDLRHTHAASLLSDDVSALVVAQRLGHSSTHTTTNVYGHITAAADGAMLSTLNRRLPDVLARDDEGAVIRQAIPSEGRLSEFDLDELDDLAP